VEKKLDPSNPDDLEEIKKEIKEQKEEKLRENLEASGSVHTDPEHQDLSE